MHNFLNSKLTCKKINVLHKNLDFFFNWKGPEFRAPGALWALTTPEKILGALRAPEALINKNLFYYRTGPTLGPRYLSSNK